MITIYNTLFFPILVFVDSTEHKVGKDESFELNIQQKTAIRIELIKSFPIFDKIFLKDKVTDIVVLHSIVLGTSTFLSIFILIMLFILVLILMIGLGINYLHIILFYFFGLVYFFAFPKVKIKNSTNGYTWLNTDYQDIKI